MPNCDLLIFSVIELLSRQSIVLDIVDTLKIDNRKESLNQEYHCSLRTIDVKNSNCEGKG